MSSSKTDPRRIDKIVPYHMPPKQSGDVDYAGNIAMAISMGGIMMRNTMKAIPWIAAYFGVASLLNTRKSRKEDTVGWSGGLLAFVSLFTYYLNMYMAYKRSEWFNADDTYVEPSSI
ncbi:hypothetical protein INT45_002480 [Circinella minor]|uniref:Uncharacterized protein n=1 Tax=Circinella minor TaxID=1195481 RepID=A0A8H7VT11_9FUNG|nr:hypothetical protein INT45_002480 [Circinella minor]